MAPSLIKHCLYTSTLKKLPSPGIDKNNAYIFRKLVAIEPKTIRSRSRIIGLFDFGSACFKKSETIDNLVERSQQRADRSCAAFSALKRSRYIYIYFDNSSCPSLIGGDFLGTNWSMILLVALYTARTAHGVGFSSRCRRFRCWARKHYVICSRRFVPDGASSPFLYRSC